jgi:Peptide N-acetyl-beta-D-glucosaminyl asparaginase amidase A
MIRFSLPAISRFLIASAAIATLTLCGVAQTRTAPSTPQVGSANTVTADPPLARPNTQPCTVQLFTNVEFANFSPKTFQYTPPADCPGPWAKIVFQADYNVTAGRQFDRTANVWIGGTNVYFGTTAEPSRTVARSWHVESDLTDYSALFTVSQPGEADLGNIVNGTFNGVLFGSASLQFYPLAQHQEAPRGADVVLPMSAGPNGGSVFLFSPSDQNKQTFALPTNIERAYLDIIAQSQIGDEFWYSCVPNDVANELQSCGGTAFREGEVSIDGQPAGVAPVYPWIYTGGVDPLLWEPIPGVQALNFIPYRVDLTPFAGVLSNGQPHTIALSVFNANNYFTATATLLIYLDRDSERVSGAVTANTIGSANPSVQENLQTAASGEVSGTVTTGSSREFKVAGFVNTSHGRVDTEVRQAVNFNNVQSFTINASTYVQDITQATDVTSKTSTRRGPAVFEVGESFHYPLTLNLALNFAADGSVTQLAEASQRFNHDVLTPFFASTTSNEVDSTDLLDLDSSFHITGNTGQKSSQHYSLVNTRGQKYDCSLQAENNVLTSATDGCTETITPNR